MELDEQGGPLDVDDDPQDGEVDGRALVLASLKRQVDGLMAGRHKVTTRKGYVLSMVGFLLWLSEYFPSAMGTAFMAGLHEAKLTKEHIVEAFQSPVRLDAPPVNFAVQR